MNNKFFFKQFAIASHQCGMPVSTDGVLLGSWAMANTPAHILDIGSGTGLLTLMMAQRFSRARITAIDLDKEAVRASYENVKASKWADRIDVVHADVVKFAELPTRQPGRFDLIICNPPYFNHGEKAQNTKRAMARHTESLDHFSLVATIRALLADEGSAQLILPSYEAEQFIHNAREYGLYCSHMLKVRSTEHKPVSRILFRLSVKVVDCEVKNLVIHAKQGYSDDFIALTKDFYLKM